MDTPRIGGTYHFLIVGIDGYSSRETRLAGCVNDAEAVVEFLAECGMDNQELSQGLFLAPRDSQIRPYPFALPTRKNLVDRLETIAAKAGADDHVWIFYSGHGTQRIHSDPNSMAVFEALVPLDFDDGGADLLYDFELARLLAQIGARTRSVTLILDCCSSAGAFRDLGLPSRTAAPGSAVRCLTLSDKQHARLPRISISRNDTSGLAWVGDRVRCEPTVIAACHADELAREDAATGKQLGVLTSTLLALLRRHVKDGNRIETLRWVDIWEELRSIVLSRNPKQQPLLSGSRGRRVLGGRPVPYDAGIAITATVDDRYELRAGQLLGLQPGSLVAVYSAEPPLFRPLNTPADRADRVSSVPLIIEKATPFQATARLLTGAAHSLPRGARARLISTALRVYVAPELRTVLNLAALEQEAAARELLLDFSGSLQSSELHLAVLANGDIALGDAAVPAFSTTPGALPLATIAREGPEAALRTVLIDAFLHMAQYRIPLRLAELARDTGPAAATLPAGQLTVDLVSCRDLRTDQKQALHENLEDRIPMVTKQPGCYELFTLHVDDPRAAPEPFAIWVRSSAGFALFVSIFDCNTDGQVETVLLNEQQLSGSIGKMFWLGGSPVCDSELRLSGARKHGTDRLVVIASTVKGSHGLESIEQTSTLQDVLYGTRELLNGHRSIVKAFPERTYPTVWTAIEIAVVLSVQ